MNEHTLDDYPKSEGDTWTVYYYAVNGDVYTRTNVKFYEMQEALMDLSREAYENGTYAQSILMK